MKKTLLLLALTPLMALAAHAGMPIKDLYGLYVINVDAQPGITNLVTLSAPNKVNLEERSGPVSSAASETCDGIFTYDQSTGTVKSTMTCKSGMSFVQTVILGNLTKKDLTKKRQSIEVASSLFGDFLAPAKAQRVRDSE